MMTLRTSLALLLMTGVTFADDKPAASKAKLETTEQKASYGFGMNIARNMMAQGFKVDVRALAAGMADVLAGKDPQLSEEDLQTSMMAVQAEMQKKAMAERAAAAEKSAAEAKKNSEVAKTFLAENAKKEGVKTTKSGLQYQVIKKGTGQTPKASSTVNAHYRGKLIDGEVFDQSYQGDAPKEGETPATFPVGRVIPGWTEALQMMKKGAQYRLFIPPELAYGVQSPPSIPPNSLLIFDIYLVDVIDEE